MLHSLLLLLPLARAGRASVPRMSQTTAATSSSPSAAVWNEDIKEAWTRAYASASADPCDYEIEEITGTIPATLRGTIFRNGPGNFERGGERFKHVLDGDGLLCRWTLDGGSGRARFASKFVATPYYEAEVAADRVLHRNTFGTQPDCEVTRLRDAVVDYRGPRGELSALLASGREIFQAVLGGADGAAVDTSDSALEAQFRRLDADGSGAIDADELRRAIAAAYGGELDERLIAQMMEDVDLNHDGGVDLAEFKTAMRAAPDEPRATSNLFNLALKNPANTNVQGKEPPRRAPNPSIASGVGQRRCARRRVALPCSSADALGACCRARAQRGRASASRCGRPRCRAPSIRARSSTLVSRPSARCCPTRA